MPPRSRCVTLPCAHYWSTDARQDRHDHNMWLLKGSEPADAQQVEHMRASRWPAASAAALVFILGACRSSPPPAAPLTSGALRGTSVLLITVDTLRRDRLGAYGGRPGLTPTLDALAAAGIRFNRAFSHAPMTLPAHASILTGRTPLRHGVRNNATFRLRDDVPTLATVLKASGYRTGAFVGAFVLDARYGLSHGFDIYDDHYASSAGGPTFGFAERRADEVVQKAGDWILSAKAGGPWLAWVHLFDPHTPYDAPADYRAGRAPYDAEVAYADAMLGRLLDRLRAEGALDRTLLVVTADHGESLGDHGETTHGLFAYDSTLAVPLILSGHGIPHGAVDGTAGHADILPTICDLLAVAPPQDLDGRSLVRPPALDRQVYFEALDANLTRGWGAAHGSRERGMEVHRPAGARVCTTSPPIGGDPQSGRPGPVTERSHGPGDAGDLQSRFGLHRRPVAGGDERRRRAAVAVARLCRRQCDFRADAAAAARGYGPGDDPKRLVALNERFNSALAAFNEGKPGDALDGFRAVLAERPDFLTARTSAATVLLAGGHAQEAVSLIRGAPEHQLDSPALQARLGIALREAGNLAAAAAHLERARAGGDENPELANDLGVVYARLGRANDARALFQELLHRDPDDASAWNNLGVLELSGGRLAEAAQAFRRAVDADPRRGDAWQGLGAALVGQDRPAAIAAWRRAERLHAGQRAGLSAELSRPAGPRGARGGARGRASRFSAWPRPRASGAPRFRRWQVRCRIRGVRCDCRRWCRW